MDLQPSMKRDRLIVLDLRGCVASSNPCRSLASTLTHCLAIWKQCLWSMDSFFFGAQRSQGSLVVETPPTLDWPPSSILVVPQ